MRAGRGGGCEGYVGHAVLRACRDVECLLEFCIGCL